MHTGWVILGYLDHAASIQVSWGPLDRWQDDFLLISPVSRNPRLGFARGINVSRNILYNESAEKMVNSLARKSQLTYFREFSNNVLQLSLVSRYRKSREQYMHSPLEGNPCLFRQEEINTDSYCITHITGTCTLYSPLERNPCLFCQEEINMDSYYITHITSTCTVHWRGIRVCFVKRK